MNSFESKLAKATSLETRTVVGAIGLVVDNKGTILYHHASGRQSLDADASPLDPDSTIIMGSAGKFITHIAALQLVERGLLKLDEPLSWHIPELDKLPLIERGTSGESFTLRRSTKKITLRHLLLHTSGMSDGTGSLISEYLASDCPKVEYEEDAHVIVKEFSLPLVFEPGEGFAYGSSIVWTQLLVTRLMGNLTKYIQDQVFNPLGMKSSAYAPRDNAEIWNRRMRMVGREGDKLVPADDASQGLMCSMSDMAMIMSDLISPAPKLLNQEHIDLLFNPQLAPSSTALEALRSDRENYSFCAGSPSTNGPPSVNWSAAGLYADDELPIFHMPEGTMTWEGMPNVLWAMNRERGLGMFFATQLIPVGDKAANDLALAFMSDAWKKFG